LSIYIDEYVKLINLTISEKKKDIRTIKNGFRRKRVVLSDTMTRFGKKIDLVM